MWRSAKTSALACFALLDYGKDTVKQELRIAFGSEKEIVLSHEHPFVNARPATLSWGSTQEGAMLQTKTDALVFASAQVTYLDHSENILRSTGEFRVERRYYILEQGKEIEISEERPLRIGDILKVKIKVISDRDLDFVYLEDPKASGWEPVEALSGYRYDNGPYYMSHRDSKTEIFIEYLRKGTHLYSYDLKVTLQGSLQVGPTKVSCYYAPEFSSNTKGQRLKIEK